MDSGQAGRGAILVTGGTGFIGVPLVEKLLQHGQRVRVLGRRPKVRWQHNPAVEQLRGDIGDPAIIAQALEGVRFVYHLAAASEGGWDNFKRTTVDAAGRLLGCLAARGGGRVVFVSSLGNYDGGAMRDDVVIDEVFPLEHNTRGRGCYALAKTAAERLAQRYLSHSSVKLSIVRPGVVYGPRMKNPLLGAAIPFRGKLWLMLGSGNKPVPFVYVDDVVDGLLRIMADRRTISQIYNLVHPQMPLQNECLAHYRRLSGDRTRLIRIPLERLIGVLALVDRVKRRVAGRDSQLAYMAERMIKKVRYSTEKLKRDVGFEPTIGFEEVMRRIYGAA